MSLYDELNSLTLHGYKNESLVNKVKLAGIRPASHLKADVVEALNQYLSKEDTILKVWHGLKSFEQDLVIDFLRWGTIDASDVSRIYAKHGLEDPYEKRYTYHSFFSSNFLPEDSKANLFFFGGRVPWPIKKVLKPFIKPYVPTYSPMESLPQEGLDFIIELGESFETDFIRLLRLINKGRLRVTKVNQFPTKATMKKMDTVLAMKEWPIPSGEDLEEVRTIEKTTRLFGLFQLLKASSLISLEKGVMVLSPKAEDFLTMNLVEKCKVLLQGYREAHDIVELNRIPEMRLTCDKKDPVLTESREVIIKHLSKCPVHQWIPLNEISYTIKKMDRRFLQNSVGHIYLHHEYQNYYSQCNDWTSVNVRFIQTALLEYLAIMGIVDVALSVSWEDYSQLAYYEVDYFRLTLLGGHVLGVYDDYTYEKEVQESGFVVQPNFEILISQGSMKDVHCLFFDGFAIKLSRQRTPIYKITFKAIVDALDKGIQVKDIIEYLQKYSEHPLPQNVLSTLESWALESERISIRTITIVEAQDPYLIEELKSYKTTHRYMKKDLENAVEIEREDAMKLKREIEKKGRFCILEE